MSAAIEAVSRGEEVTYKFDIGKRYERNKLYILNGSIPNISIMQTVSYLLKWPSMCNAFRVIAPWKHSRALQVTQALLYILSCPHMRQIFASAVVYVPAEDI